MKVDVDVICNVCDSVFCCAQCRHKHELKHHAIVVEQRNDDDEGEEERAGHTTKIYLFCSLCAKRPLELREHMYDEMAEHIRAKHLPLHCLKCHKRYTSVSDLRQFSKCLHPMLPCHDELAECSATTEQTSSSTDTSKVTVRRDYRQNGAAAAVTMSTQTSPMRHNFNETHLTTPIAVINSHWKAKYKISHEEMISDSVSSIRNLSSISNSSLRRSIDLVPKGKGTLVRSTSTPVHSEIVYAKPKEQLFNGTGMGQVSSIYTSHCEAADNSPALPPAGMSPKPVENVNRYFKVGGRAKISAVTPLRQVMSKSIQKAFAEHGAPQSASFRPQGPVMPSRKIYDSHDSFGGESSSPPPLDLRLSPAVRRTKNRLSFNLQDLQPPSAHKNVIQPADVMMSTESIVITRTRYSRNSMAGSATNQSESASTSASSSMSTSESTTKNGSSVYKTCQSVEIITSTTAELSEVNLPQDNDPNVKDDLGMLASALVFTRTPVIRSQGPITSNKKLQFDTPHTKSAKQKSPMNEDVFFTPEVTPARKPKLRRQSGDASPTSRADADKAVMPRKLSNGFSTARRPNLLDCKDSEVFSHAQDVSDDDEVFLPQIASTNKQRSAEKFPRDQADGTDTTTVGKDLKSSWSLRSFVSSVMRLPVLKGKATNAKGDKDAAPSETSTNCSIKRSSSIAGSMVRPQSVSEHEQMNTLKRKRTYTMDNHHSMFLTQLNHSTEVSPPADHSLNVSSKKFRIQGRKPLERMMRRDT